MRDGGVGFSRKLHEAVADDGAQWCLGSGETTLLNYVLANRERRRAAVIVNHMSAPNIDVQLVELGGASAQLEFANVLGISKPELAALEEQAGPMSASA